MQLLWKIERINAACDAEWDAFVSYLLIAAVSLGASEPLIDDHPIVSVSAAAAAAY